MLADRYDPEDVFVRVSEVAAQTGQVLKTLDRLFDWKKLFAAVTGPIAAFGPGGRGTIF